VVSAADGPGTDQEMDEDARAERARALILLRATLITVADRLDEDSLEDLGLLDRIGELADLVELDLQRLADERAASADESP
jgi:hypothetical protein